VLADGPRGVAVASQIDVQRSVTSTTPDAAAGERDSRAALDGRVLLSLHRLPWIRLTVAAMAVAAIALRAIQYFSNTSLSLDESALSLNILNRSYSGLLHQLDFGQGAPPLFLFGEKASVQLFGDSEYSLRALPFIAGIGSVLLFIPFARKFLPADDTVQLIAVALFGSSTILLLYSATVKPYSLDVVVTLGLYLIATRLFSAPTRKWSLVLAAGGLIGTAMSFAAVFVVSGIGLTLIGRSALRRRWREATAYAVAPGIWGIWFAVLYVVSIKDLGHLRRSLSYDRTNAVTNPVDTLRTLSGAFRSLLGIGELDVAGVDLGRFAAVAGIALALAGVVALLRSDPFIACLLAAPIALTLLAWTLGLYPIYPRTLLFLAPLLIALIAHGAVRLFAGSGMAVLGGAALVIVAAAAIIPGVRTAADPQELAHMRPAVHYLAAQQNGSDTVWVTRTGQFELRYYWQCGCFGPAPLVARGERLWKLEPGPGGPEQFAPALRSNARFVISQAETDAGAYRTELRTLRGRRRVWILVADAPATTRNSITAYLDRIGHGQLRFRAGHGDTGVSLYLYDLER
jgi:hypothetical protein